MLFSGYFHVSFSERDTVLEGERETVVQKIWVLLLLSRHGNLKMIFC